VTWKLTIAGNRLAMHSGSASLRPKLSFTGTISRQTVMTVLLGNPRKGWMRKGKSLPRCPRCLARLVLRWSRLTSYLACPNYPNCKSQEDRPKHPGRVIECCRVVNSASFSLDL